MIQELIKQKNFIISGGKLGVETVFCFKSASD